MLKKINRVKSQKAFKQIFAKGAAVQGKNLIIRVFPNELGCARFGLIVSSKIDKRATVRNRLRRQLSEIIRSELIKIKPGFDVVVISKKGLAVLSFGEIQRELLVAFKKVRIL